MAGDRDEFFALLEGLTPKEIEARLSSWDREELSLVQEYLERKELDRTKVAQAGQADSAPSKDAAKAAVEMAMGANMRATAALIISAGAMLAAVLSAIIALVGLRQ